MCAGRAAERAAETCNAPSRAPPRGPTTRPASPRHDAPRRRRTSAAPQSPSHSRALPGTAIP
eukprot:3599603-Pleurochrysis_carterae.AAC.1